MKYCRECGDKLGEETKYCVNCGTKVEDTLAEAIFGKEKSKRYRTYNSLSMVASFCFGMMLGSWNWRNAPEPLTVETPMAPVPPVASIHEPFLPLVKEETENQEEPRFRPAVRLEQNEQNRVVRDDFLLLFDEKDVILLEYLGYQEEVDIPEEVTIIGAEAFMNQSQLKVVNCSNNVVEIQENAFALCLYLGKIVFSEDLVTLGEGAFRNCESLTAVILPDSLEEIGDFAFYGCEQLTSVDTGGGVVKIGTSAFQNCWNLHEVTLSQRVKTIEDFAFDKCAGIKVITLPESLEKIGKDAFIRCFSLEEVWVADGTYGEDYVKEHLPLITIQKKVL